jgi:hypothetical protein
MNDTIENSIFLSNHSADEYPGSHVESEVVEVELPNIALAPEEVATLHSLIERYDKVIQDLDFLNTQIETLLAQETIKACDS